MFAESRLEFNYFVLLQSLSLSDLFPNASFILTSVFRVSSLFCRQKLIKEKAVPKIEGYMFEEHDLVRASATECMCNLVLSTEVIK